MANEFTVLFTLEVEKTQQQSLHIEVADCEYLELPRQEGPDIKDVLEPYEIERNIECDERIETLQVGEYDCLLAGTWDYEITYDAEGNKDGELMIDIKFLAIQKYVDPNKADEPDEWGLAFTSRYIQAKALSSKSIKED
jgi:hypothetical protein